MKFPFNSILENKQVNKMPSSTFEKQKKDKKNPLFRFFFAIIIPGIVVITVTVIILSIAGINVIDWAKKAGSNIPVVSSLITEDEKTGNQQEEKTNAVNAKKDQEIATLNEENNNLEATVENLEQDILKLENKEKSEQNAKKEVDDEDEAEDAVKKAASSFRKMDKKQAASIFQSLDKETAVAILQELSNNVRGEILEAMDPKMAADFTQRLINDDD